MGQKEILAEEKEEVKERLFLVMDRIAQIADTCPEREEETKEAADGNEGSTQPQEFEDYFTRTASFILATYEALQQEEAGRLGERTLEECKSMNDRLYSDIAPEHYADSYGNPSYAVKMLGEEYGAMLSMLYAELRALIAYAFEGRWLNYTILCELFIQIFTCFEDEEGASPKEVKDIIYWFFHDYSEIFSEQSVKELVDPGSDFFTRIVMDSDLTDLTYLYRYGEPVGKMKSGLRNISIRCRKS